MMRRPAVFASLLVFGLWVQSAAGQTPSCAVAEGFQAAGDPREYDTETLYDYMDGNSEGYFLYSFVRMKGVNCTRGNLRMVIDVSEFKNDEFAYGMFTATVDPRQPQAKIGTIAQITPNKMIFVKGKYYGEISIEPSGDHQPVLEAAARKLEPLIPGGTQPPAALAWFPTEGISPGSPRLIAQSVLGLRMLERGYLAMYGADKAFVVPVADAKAAEELLAKLKTRFAQSQQTAPAFKTKVDEVYLAEDRYLGSLLFFRKGNHLAGYVAAKPESGEPSIAQAAARADALAGRLP